jgi:16S rRNA pseudouridine516 synthase
MVVRLDKYLSQVGLVSRRSVGKILQSWAVLVDGVPIYKSDHKVAFWQIITFAWTDIEVKEHVYVLLHKPTGYVCSDIDEWGHRSYQVLLHDCPYASMLHVAWRLDFDTEWLVLCTSDWQFTHTIISPKKHLEKEYFVRTRDEIHDKALFALEEWVVLDDWYKTLPAKTIKEWSHSFRLKIVEWKFHQIKRMLEAVWNEVVYLRRDKIGDRSLEGIDLWKWRYIDC